MRLAVRGWVSRYALCCQEYKPACILLCGDEQADMHLAAAGMGIRMKIAMIRHGKTPGNEKKRYIGRTDESILPSCAADILALRVCLQKQFPDFLQAFWAVSPMLRCLQTAALLSGEGKEKVLALSAAQLYDLLRRQKMQVVEGLRECDFGEFENKNYRELSDNVSYQRWIDSGGMLPFPGGESKEEFEERSCRAFMKLLREIPSGRDVVLVAHGGTIMSILSRFALDEEGGRRDYFGWSVPNAQGYLLKLEGGAELAEGEAEPGPVLHVCSKLRKF